MPSPFCSSTCRRRCTWSSPPARIRQLPLARLRARGQLTELRAADLRFTPAEAAAFLNQVMGLDLSAADIAALEDRTEGWIAGLQLAALSMQGHQDVPGFIRAFAGDHRYIVDYLVEEVLQRQPEDVRSFLLQTSILDRLSGPLCDAVTGQEDGDARLEALERGNFFVVPLDDTAPLVSLSPPLCRRAPRAFAGGAARSGSDAASARERVVRAAWFGGRCDPPRAGRRGFRASGGPGRAGSAGHAPESDRRPRCWAGSRRSPTSWSAAGPCSASGMPEALLASGELEGVEARLRDAERWLDTTADRRERPDAPAAEMVVVDEEEFRRLPGAIAVARAGQALALGDVADTVTIRPAGARPRP